MIMKRLIFCSGVRAGCRGYIFRLAATILLINAVFTISAFAQSASVTGRVFDPSETVVNGARITLSNDKTNAVVRTSSNTVGAYGFPYVQPGVYTLLAEAPGFAQYRATGISISTAQPLVLDVKLQLGIISQSITVEADAVSIPINIIDGSVSTIIDRTFVQDLPLNGRSFKDLMTLIPGVVAPPSGNGQFGSFNVNGQRAESNAFIVDGVLANTGPGSNGTLNPNGSANSGTAGVLSPSTAMGTTQGLLSVDAMEEFRVLGSSFSSEYGRFPGGQFVFTSRSGTNQYHGSASEYFRNDIFDANNWFNNFYGTPGAPLRLNDFGGTFGGPVWIPKLYDGRDRTFFFVSYEGLRSRQPQSAATSYVPSINIRETADPVVQPFLKAFSMPTGPEIMVPCSAAGTPCPSGVDEGTPVPSGLALYVRPYSSISNFDSTSVRINHDFGSNTDVFFRFASTPSEITSRNRGTFGGAHYDNKTYTVGVTSQWAGLANSFRLNWSESRGASITELDDFGGAIPFDFNKAIGVSDFPTALPSFWIMVAGVGNTNIGTASRNNTVRQWNIVDTVSKSMGNHMLKFGFDFRHVNSPLNIHNPQVTTYFNNTEQLRTNVAGRLAVFTRTRSEPVFNQYALFAQDEWRVFPKVSLSLGLRWDINTAPHNAIGPDPLVVQGNISDPASLTLAPRGTPLYETSYSNFAPRVGVAWVARANSGWETVVRTGGGIFFDTANSAVVGYFSNGPGISGSGNYTFVGIPVTAEQISAAMPSTTISAPYSGLFASRNMKLPYTAQWNISVEQALGRAQTFTMSYVGASGRRLINKQRFTPGEANPAFESVDYIVDTANTSSYNAMQIQFQRVAVGGVQTLVAYTWSHSIDYGSGYNTIPLVRGNSDFDLRHNFQAALSWNLPTVNSNPVLKKVLSGWAVDGRLIIRSGFPVGLSGREETDPVTGAAYQSGVDMIPGQPLYLYGATCKEYYITHGDPNQGRGCPGDRAVNPAAFSLPVDGVAGNVPRNFVRGFGAKQINFAIRRELPLGESVRLQIRAEAFNLFNHPNFSSINNGVGNASFGLATQMLNTSMGSPSALFSEGGPRSMQFMMKLSF
jgi:hypothetical protein